MKRPHLENYYDTVLTKIPPIYISGEEQYRKAMEQYCDKLEVALNKTIELLARNDILQMNNEEEWKEWLFKDE